MQIKKNTFLAILLVSLVSIALVLIITFTARTQITPNYFGVSMSSTTVSEKQNSDTITLQIEAKKKPEPVVAKAVYLTAYSAASAKKRAEIINLIAQTELNAVVIDIKDYSGKVLYDSNLLVVNELKTDEDRLGDVRKIIQEFHDAGIYVIARQTVFQDPVLAERKPDWAVKSTHGGLWRDRNGLAWVDASNDAVWRYNIAIAREAIRLGFDEINFDYVRFPSDGNLATMSFAHLDRPKYEVMGDFYATLSRELSHEPAYISLDMFGFVMERTGTNDLAIGQRLADAVDQVDYIAPMMYPSHYPSGHLGFSNPAAHPGPVIAYGMKLGMPHFEGKRAQVRPWIQAFNMGATYGAAEIRAQIDEIEKYPNAGWLLWNASNRYSAAGLRAN